MEQDDKTGNVTATPQRIIVEALPPERELDKRFKWGKAILEVLAFLALVVYVLETHRTNDLTQQALNTQRPWVGMRGEADFAQVSDKGSFRVNYTLKNFGPYPALNTIVQLEPPVEDANNYALVKAKVNTACQSAENIISQTGDLLLPTAEKPDNWTFGDKVWPRKFVIPGCIVYRDPRQNVVHHTQLCYWIDLSAEPRPQNFSRCWFQGAD